MTKSYFVYIITNFSEKIYVRVTSNLAKRLEQHKAADNTSFASLYNISKLVYVEAFDEARTAVAREKQLNGWRREKKMRLIARNNPDLNEILTS